MNTLQKTFELISIEVFGKLFKLVSNENQFVIDNSILKDYIYIKTIDVQYGAAWGNICIACSQKMIDVLKESSEEHIQRLYTVINPEYMFSNMLGLVLYKMYSVVKPVYYDFKFRVLEETSYTHIAEQKKILQFSKEKEDCMYLGFSFSE